MHHFASFFFLITPIHTTSFYQLHKKIKTERQILYQFDSATISIWSCSFDGNTAPVLEWDSPSDRRPQLSWSMLEAVRLGRRWSVGSAPILVCSPLAEVRHKLYLSRITKSGFSDLITRISLSICIGFFSHNLRHI